MPGIRPDLDSGDKKFRLWGVPDLTMPGGTVTLLSIQTLKIAVKRDATDRTKDVPYITYVGPDLKVCIIFLFHQFILMINDTAIHVHICIPYWRI